MKESVTYQAILEEGRVDGIKKMLLVLGTDRFGAPDEATSAVIGAINEEARLEELSKRLLHVSSWEELLAPPRPRRRNGRRKNGS